MSKEAFTDNLAEDLGIYDDAFESEIGTIGSFDLGARLLSSESLSPSLPSMSFAASAVYSREGDDLVLTLNGETVVVTNYFATPTPPTLTTMDGAILSPSFIASFLPHAADQDFYAFSLLKSLLGDKSLDSNTIAVLDSLEGSVLVIRNGKATLLQQGDQIFQGDEISTASDSSASIVFADGTQFKIGSEARIALDSFSFESSTSQGLQLLSILSGAFSYVSGLVAKNDPANVQLRTPFGEIGIRGTKIVGEVDTEKAEASVTLLEGRIIYKSPQGEEYEINQGFDTLKIKNGGETVRETTISADRVAKEYDVFENVGEVSNFIQQQSRTQQDQDADATLNNADTPLPDISYGQAQAEIRALEIAGVILESTISIEDQRGTTLQELLGKDQSEDSSLIANSIFLGDTNDVLSGGDSIYHIVLNLKLDNQVSVLRGGGVLTGDVLNFIYYSNTKDPTFKFFQGELEVGIGKSGNFNYGDSVRNWNQNGEIGSGGGQASESSDGNVDLMIEVTYDTNNDNDDELFVLILADYFPILRGHQVPTYSIAFNGVDQGDLAEYGGNKALVDAAFAAI